MEAFRHTRAGVGTTSGRRRGSKLTKSVFAPQQYANPSVAMPHVKLLPAVSVLKRNPPVT